MNYPRPGTSEVGELDCYCREAKERVHGLESALQGLVDMCELHLPKIDGAYYTAREGGYYIERELRIARDVLPKPNRLDRSGYG